MEPIADFRGARSSNAGDQFHELWALEQVLALLDHRRGLTAITVEGVRTERLALVDDEPYWDGVDCALYFGGHTLETAQRMEFAQLKYSSDHTLPWSIARLSKSSAKRGNNSVLRRLADDFRSARTRMKPSAPLTLRLVSNQPVADTALHVLCAMAEAGSIPNEREGDIAAVARATALEGEDLRSFLSSLDVSECGTASRFSHRERVILAIAGLLEDNAASDVAELRQRMRELMLPERHRDLITFETVLAWFGLADRSGLFPCPQKTRTVERPILRSAAKELMRIIEAGAKLVCIHGPAGCGKTTVIKQLGGILPEGSCLVLFDCYGAGSYLSSDDKRHLPGNAFLQIANDLALELATPFLMPRGGQQPIDVRQFLKRVSDAASVVNNIQSGAILVLAIDAADNSVTAANRESSAEPCFVHELVRANWESLPSNVRIVVSARTARIDSLCLPRNVARIECPPFSLPETGEYVRGLWPQASQAWIAQFHHLSHGIPRVQDYAVKMAAGDESKVLDALRPTGRQLNDVLRRQCEEAGRKIGQQPVVDSLITLLATLPPPIPVSHLAAVAGTTPAVVDDFVRDMSPGLRLEVAGIFVADEDFEDFIKVEAQPHLGVVQPAVADHLLRHHRSDPYAATHVADALIAAHRGAELLPLVEGDPKLDVIPDPIVRREVHLRRLRLALKACHSAANSLDTLKIILIGADANRDEAVLRDLLEGQTELAVHFAWPTLRRLVLADRDRVEGQGRVLAYDAARAGRVGDRCTIRERLVAYDAWLRQRNAVSEEERERWRVADEDLVARAEAIFELAGPTAVLDDLSRWRPRTILARVGLRLIPHLIVGGKRDSLVEVLQKSLLKEPWSILLTVPLALSGVKIEADAVAHALVALRAGHCPRIREVLHSFGSDHWPQLLFELLLTACELAVHLRVESTTVLRALRLLRGNLWSQMLTSQATALDAVMRIWFLEQHLKGEPTAPEVFLKTLEPKPSKDDEKPSEKRRRIAPSDHGNHREELNTQIRALFPIYAGRLQLIGDHNVPRDDNFVRNAIQNIAGAEYSFDHSYWSVGLRARAALSVMRLMMIPDLPASALLERAVEILGGRSNNTSQGNILPLLEHLALRHTEHPLLLKTVSSRLALVRQTRSPSSEKVESFAQFGRLLLRISPPDARALFIEAIEMTKEIDQEAFDQIKLLQPLSKCSSVMPIAKRREIAAEIDRFVSGVAERLPNDGFPWEETVVALARLSLPVGLAVLARWEDQGVVDLETTLTPILMEALRLGDLSPTIVSAVAVLLTKPRSELIQRALKVAQGSAGIVLLGEEFAQDCLLHAPQNERLELARVILSFLPPQAIESSQVLPLLRSTVAFLEKLPRESPGQEALTVTTGHRSDLSDDMQEALQDFSGHRFTTVEEIGGMLERNHKPGQPFRVRELLLQMRKVTTLADQIPFLDSLAGVALDPIWDNDRAAVILDALDAWKDSPAVELWRTQTLPLVIVRHFAGFTRYLPYRESHLQELLTAAQLSEAQRLRVLVEGVEGAGLSLGSGTLFAVAELIIRVMLPDTAASVLLWYVTRLGARIPLDPPRLPDVSDVPASATDALGRFLFALLSDVDTRLRWRAAHALRRLARLGAVDVLDVVLKNWDRRVDTSFREPSAPFYWLAARLWLAMALDRIAGESPSAVAPHFGTIRSIAMDSSLPHVLIREHAKRAALRLVEQGHVRVKQADLARIRRINAPRRKKISVILGNLPASLRQQASTHTFQFDLTDTVPYWYEPVLSRFPTAGMHHFLDRAEYWIMSKWGAPANANWWAEEPRKARYDDRRFGYFLHSHGNLPTIERYGTHLEWHAMLCTVGELLETHPVKNSADSFDSFDDWLSRRTPTDADQWISDGREPTPLESRVWVQDPRSDAAWLRTSRGSEFTDELGIGKDGRIGWIVVGARYDVQLPTRELNVSISSALVSPETASALVRALQTVSNPYSFCIPAEKADAQIDTGPYRLIGWLAWNREEMGFDEHDPLRQRARPLVQLPGQVVSDMLSLRRAKGPYSHWTSVGQANPSFLNETWSDPWTDDDRAAGRIGSNGWRLWMRRPDLHSFLQQQCLDLIYEVQVIRQTRSRYSHSYDSDKGKRKTFDKILLCRRGGQIEGIAGPLGSWTAPSR